MSVAVLGAAAALSLSEVPIVSPASFADAVGDCKAATIDQKVSDEILTLRGWQPATLKGQRRYVARKNTLRAKGADQPVLFFEGKAGSVDICTVLARVDAETDARKLVGVIGSKVGVTKAERLMAAIVLTSEPHSIFLNIGEEQRAPLAKAGIFSMRRK